MTTESVPTDSYTHLSFPLSSVYAQLITPKAFPEQYCPNLGGLEDTKIDNKETKVWPLPPLKGMPHTKYNTGSKSGFTLPPHFWQRTAGRGR